LGLSWGARGFGSGAGLDCFELERQILALVLPTPRNLEVDAHQLQRVELRAGCKDFVGYFVRCCRGDNRQAVFGLAVRLIAVEDLDVLLARFTVEAWSAEKCNFHSRTCHLVFPLSNCALLRCFAFCRPSDPERVKN